MVDVGFVLPPEIADNLAANNERPVGEWLKEEVESLARTNATTALTLLRSIEPQVAGRPVLEGYLEWSRGIVSHFDGAALDAATRLKSASSIFIRLKQNDLSDRVGLLLVDVYGVTRDLPRARRLASRLKLSFQDRGDNERAALALAALAGAEDGNDRVARAGALWRQALSGLAPGSFRAQMVQANLANVSMMEGRLEEAIRGHARIAEKAESLGFDRLKIQAETNLAEAEFRSGRVDVALRRWHRVIEVARRQGHSFEEAVALLELAVAEAEIGDRKACAQNLVGLEEKFKNAGLISDGLRVQRLSALINAGDNAGSWRSTYETLILQKDEAAAHLLLVDVASAFGGVPAEELKLAAAFLRREGLSARAFLAQALAARQNAGDGHHDEAAKLAATVVAANQASPWARLIARYALAVSQPQIAGRHLAAAIKIADGLLGRLASASDRSAFLNLRQEIYLEAISRLLDRGRARERHRALDLVNRFNSGWLMDELAHREDKVDDPEVKRWVSLRRRLAALLAEMEGETEPRIRKSGLNVREHLRTIEREIDGAERGLARRKSGSIIMGRMRGVGSHLVSKLPKGHRLLEILPDGENLIVFGVGKNGLEARRHSNVKSALRRLVASARFHLDARPWLTNGRGGQMDRAFESTLARLGAMLLDGVDLDGIETLWVAPHGMLYGVPWAGLTLADGSRLMDHVTITIVPGSAVAGRLLEEQGVQPARFGFAGSSAGDLPEVAVEIRELENLVPASDVVCDSDRASFIHMLKTCDSVHLAGHAVFLDGLPAASGLKMNDGFISVHDLAASRINTKLVTFGVCSGTRIAESDPTRSEGFLRALMAGGVRTVVGSVSPVRDDVARVFSIALYQGLTRHWVPGDAWREAVAEVRKQFQSPAYWGSFQIFGDPRPMKFGSN